MPDSIPENTPDLLELWKSALRNSKDLDYEKELEVFKGELVAYVSFINASVYISYKLQNSTSHRYLNLGTADAFYIGKDGDFKLFQRGRHNHWQFVFYFSHKGELCGLQCRKERTWAKRHIQNSLDFEHIRADKIGPPVLTTLTALAAWIAYRNGVTSSPVSVFLMLHVTGEGVELIACTDLESFSRPYLMELSHEQWAALRDDTSKPPASELMKNEMKFHFKDQQLVSYEQRPRLYPYGDYMTTYHWPVKQG